MAESETVKACKTIVAATKTLVAAGVVGETDAMMALIALTPVGGTPERRAMLEREEV
jgi:hypothetical protein